MLRYLSLNVILLKMMKTDLEWIKMFQNSIVSILYKQLLLTTHKISIQMKIDIVIVAYQIDLK
jgi:hypothetical protein